MSRERWWFRAFTFPTLEASQGPYEAMQAYTLSLKPRPPDCYGCRIMLLDANDEPKPAVLVISDEPTPLTELQIERIEGILSSSGTRLHHVDRGALRVLYQKWQQSRGLGPPIVTRGRNELLRYT